MWHGLSSRTTTINGTGQRVQRRYEELDPTALAAAVWVPHLIIQVISHGWLRSCGPLCTFSKVLLDQRPIGTVLKEPSPPGHGSFYNFISDNHEDVSWHGSIHSCNMFNNAHSLSDNNSQIMTVAPVNVTQCFSPVDVKSGVLYSTDQSMGSGLLTTTPSWRRILHISSISAKAFFKWSAGKDWPPCFW